MADDEWQARIVRAINDVRRRDYRALEARVEHHLLMTRWFKEWGSAFRPGTHYSEQPLALTWQWEHVVHGHLPLSPTWRGKRPLAQALARYRQFADSLDRQQRFELGYALHKRA